MPGPGSINKYARKRLEDLEREGTSRARVEELDEDEKRRRKIAKENRERIKRGEKPKPIR